MFRSPQTRKQLAILGIVLGLVFAAGVVWSVMTGETPWWSLILLLPAVAIMSKLYVLLQRGGGQL